MNKAPVTREFIESALRVWYPETDLQVQETDFNNRLEVAFKVGDRRYLVASPPSLDYKVETKEYWLHRFSEAIRTKLVAIEMKRPLS